MKRWEPSMLFRVRASAIILNTKQEVLLVLHNDQQTGETWLMPPGGGLEAGEDALKAVVREVWEECGVVCQPGKLLYVREYVSYDASLHHLGLFFEAKLTDHTAPLTVGTDPELSEQIIENCGFYSRETIHASGLSVYPEILIDTFWEDLKKGFDNHQVYLGQQRE